jgi:hypothetical protein
MPGRRAHRLDGRMRSENPSPIDVNRSFRPRLWRTLMNNQQFDRLSRVMREDATRRTLGRLLAGSALSGLAARWAVPEPAVGKGKRKKHRRGDRCSGSLPKRCSPTASSQQTCYPAGSICCGPSLGGGACAQGFECCPPTQGAPDGNCAGVDEVCCSVANGGGFCPTHLPVCCGPTLVDPQPQCIPAGWQCCPFGGYCYADETCCAPSATFPQGVCVSPGVACPRGAVAGLQDTGHFAPIRQATSEGRRERPRIS